MFLAGVGGSPAGAEPEGRAASEARTAAATRTVSDARTGLSIGDTAYAMPRLSAPEPEAEVALPQPLASGEAARIRRIYQLQAHGDMTAAGRETAQLGTAGVLAQAMLGHVLADRHLSRFTRPGADELRGWLARWPDLPEAADVRDLLVQRLRAKERHVHAAEAPPLPANPTLAVPKAASDTDDADDAQQGLSRSADLDQSLWAAARHRGGGGVTRLLARTSGLDAPYRSQLLGEAGRILFAQGSDAEAYDLGAAGTEACRRARQSEDCRVASDAGFSAGLAAWRMGRFDLARPMFEAAWHARLTTTGRRAGAALWAARAALRTGDFDAYGLWLNRAALERGTFYGLLAQRMLQLSRAAGARDGWGGQDTLSVADVDAVAATPAGRQALALLQVGQRGQAEAELRRLWPQMQATPALRRGVLLVADRAQLTDLAAQLDELRRDADRGPRGAEASQPRRSAWFRIPDLRPQGGFRVDPALVLGLVRTESNFDNATVSSVGASGIMQLMPDTASFIVDGAGEGHGRPATSDARLREMLADPASNLALGQRYVVYLAGRSLVNGSLVHLLASYNCGPSRMAQWIGGLRDQGDPLLFIEAVPIDETRHFIARVLTYTWLYASRLRLPAPSLDELAVGAWPRYRPLPAHYDFPEHLH